jgi:immune inhibitor A
MKRPWLTLSVISVIIGLMFCFLVVVGLMSLNYLQRVEVSSEKGSLLVTNSVTETPAVLHPTPLFRQGSRGFEAELVPPVGLDTMEALENIVLTPRDLRDLASRLEGKENIPLTVESPQTSIVIGTERTFWATNVDTAHTYQVTATLQHVGEHAYFWIQDGITYNEKDLHDLMEIFDTQIYPTNRQLFGSEWNPGVDGDPRLYMVYLRGIGRTVAGYYSSADQYHPLAHKYSNGHEIFFLSADNLTLKGPGIYSVIAHEFQHMIHWHHDRNEETWMNEGLSELASFINGYPSGHEQSYVNNPHIQLNDWPVSPGKASAHYGASFLFFTYLMDRFGEDVIRELVAHQTNGLASIDNVFDEMGIRDPLIGNHIQADDVYIDWLVANLLQDDSVGDGRYSYSNYTDAPQISPTKVINSCPHGLLTREVHQYGFDAIHITCSGDYLLYFEGSTEVAVLPIDPYSGNFAFWSNRGDESNMTLTQTFDFSYYEGPLTLTYQAWYDIEEDYDYLYLVASLDGENWQILSTPSGTAQDPSGNNYGWAYTGISGAGDAPQWIREEVDISQFAGHQVQLRFKYVTDAAVHGEGFLLDDIAISEIGYFTDFEIDDGGWEADGWVRIRNLLPQFYRLALITLSDVVSVEYVYLEPDNTAMVPLNLSGEAAEVILVVTGTTRYTRQTAPYRFSIVE